MIRLGDQTKKVLDSNLNTFREIFLLFKNQIEIDLDLILKFINDQKTRVWQIVGVNIIKIMLDNDYPIFCWTKNACCYKTQTELMTNQECKKMMSTFEKSLLNLTSLNSKHLLKVLGEVFGKLEKAKILFSGFECLSGEYFGVKLMENSPKVSKKLLVLMNEISISNNSFYGKQACFRNKLLEVFKSFNQIYILYSLSIIGASFENGCDLSTSELHFIASDVFNALLQVLKINNVPILSLSIKLLVKILSFDTKTYIDIVCRQCLSLSEIVKNKANKGLHWEFGMFIGQLLENLIKMQAKENQVCQFFVLLIKFSTRFDFVYQKLLEIEFFNRISTIHQFCNSAINFEKLGDIVVGFNVFFMAFLKFKSNGSIEFLLELKKTEKQEPNKNSLTFGTNGLVTGNISNNDYTIRCFSSSKVETKKKHLETNPNIEEEFSATPFFDDDLIDEEIREDDFNDIFLDPYTSRDFRQNTSETKLVRFSKETNEMMPGFLLQKYKKCASQNDYLPREDSNSFNLFEMMFKKMKICHKFIEEIFLIFCFEIVGSCKNEKKKDFVAFLMDFYVKVFQKNDEMVEMVSNLVFNLYKNGRLITTTNELLLTKINLHGLKSLSLIMNEEYLYRMSKSDYSNKKKEELGIRIMFELDEFQPQTTHIGLKRIKTSSDQKRNDESENIKKETTLNMDINSSKNHFIENEQEKKVNKDTELFELNVKNKMVNIVENDPHHQLSPNSIRQQMNNSFTQKLHDIAQNSQGVNFQVNFELISLIHKNIIDYSLNLKNHYIFKSLNKSILGTNSVISSLDLDDEFTELFEKIQTLQIPNNNSLVAELLLTQTKECNKKLQEWEEIITLVVEDESDKLKFDENDQLKVTGFSKIKNQNQQQLIRALLNDRKYKRQFNRIVKEICHTKSEKAYFERIHSSDLCLFWLENEDINRAKYFNEVAKEEIRLNKIHDFAGKNDELFFEIENCMLISNVINFIHENRGAETSLPFDSISQQLLFKKENTKNVKEECIFDHFFALNTLTNSLLSKFKFFDCSILEKTKIYNQLKFAQFFIEKHNIGKAENILKEIRISDLSENTKHLYEFALCFSNLNLEKIRMNVKVENLNKHFSWEGLQNDEAEVRLKSVYYSYIIRVSELKNEKLDAKKLSEILFEVNDQTIKVESNLKSKNQLPINLRGTQIFTIQNFTKTQKTQTSMIPIKFI